MAKPPSPKSSPDLVDLVPPARLLPGEDRLSFDALREALLRDLNPSTAYEKVLAENLVTLEWEAARFRRLRDDLLVSRALESAAKVFDGPMTVFPSASSKREAAALLGPDGPERRQAIAALENAGTNIDELLAGAYASEARTLDPLGREIAEIEVRRRRLLDGFERLKAQNARDIPEAELVTDHDD